ncbi:MAG: hypothetical protein ACI9F9_001120 [Candidatus Paceibacteria bacterium]|jgi:hypothetical protein
MRFLCFLIPLLVGLPVVVAGGEEDPQEIVRGVTISTPAGGRDWGSDGMLTSLREIKAMGGNWVTIHPYAGISDGTGRRGGAIGQVQLRSDLDPEHPPQHLVRPIVEAHALGLKILIKPHLAYWGTGFKWRGEIDFESEEAYARFFESYKTWIVSLAKICQGADAFVVGTELDRTLSHETEWRAIIGELREVLDGPLTYAANWDSYQDVPFWDALDVVGVQAYFPVSTESTADQQRIRKGWEPVLAELRRYSTKHNRKIVFTEIGYNLSTNSGIRPWENRVERGEEAQRIQEACLRVSLEMIEREPCVVGCFLWKWFPGSGRRPRDFNMQEPRIVDLVESIWGLR